jgi:hypothetical protein
MLAGTPIGFRSRYLEPRSRMLSVCVRTRVPAPSRERHSERMTPRSASIAFASRVIPCAQSSRICTPFSSAPFVSVGTVRRYSVWSYVVDAFTSPPKRIPMDSM